MSEIEKAEALCREHELLLAYGAADEDGVDAASADHWAWSCHGHYLDAGNEAVEVYEEADTPLGAVERAVAKIKAVQV